MTTALDLPTSAYENNKLLTEIAKTNSYIPRIELLTMKKPIVLAGKFPANHWALVKGKGQLVDLGLSITLFPLCYRFKAIDFSGPKVKSYYDPASLDFEHCRVEADRKLPEGVTNQYMCGPDFLFLTAEHGYVTYLLANKSSKQIAQSLNALLQQRVFVQLGSYLVQGPPYTYQAPIVSPANGNFEFQQTNEEITKVATDFMKIKIEEVEQTPVGTEATVENGRTR